MSSLNDVEPEVVRQGRHWSCGAGGMNETWGNWKVHSWFDSGQVSFFLQQDLMSLKALWGIKKDGQHIYSNKYKQYIYMLNLHLWEPCRINQLSWPVSWERQLCSCPRRRSWCRTRSGRPTYLLTYPAWRWVWPYPTWRWVWPGRARRVLWRGAQGCPDWSR